MILNGADFQGNGGGVKPEQDGTYPATLVSAEIYKNDNFEKTELVPQITLVWDLGEVENDDGETVPLLVYDSFIKLSLNEKATFTKRMKALTSFEEKSCNLVLENDGNVNNLENLPHRTDARLKVTKLEINGESMIGKEALVSLELKDNGWPKVTGVSKPIAQPKRAAKPVEASTTAPTPPGL